MRNMAVLTGMLCALAACNSGDAGQTNDGTPSAVATVASDQETDAHQADAGWNITRQTDPMNDEASAEAKKTIMQGSHHIDVAISCNAHDQAAYTFTVYDQQDQPAAMASDFVFENGNATQRATFQMRADDNVATQIHSKLRYENQVVATAEAGRYDQEGDKLLAARKITVRLPLQDGEETFAIDQTDLKLTGVLSTCRARLLRKQEDSRKEAEATEAARQTCIAGASRLREIWADDAKSTEDMRAASETICPQDGRKWADAKDERTSCVQHPDQLYTPCKEIIAGQSIRGLGSPE